MASLKKEPGFNLMALGQHRKWFILWGSVLFMLGVVAMGSALMFTLLTITILGLLLSISGLLITLDSLVFLWYQWGGFLPRLVMGIAYLLTGAIFILEPDISASTLTLFLGMFYTVMGLFRLLHSVSLRIPRWQFSVFNGLITFALGVLIIINWPNSGLYTIGLFIGIDLMFTGLAYLVSGLVNAQNAIYLPKRLIG